jgi:Bacterial capsule synthesis protein PGA_cap
MLGRTVAERLADGVWSDEVIALCRDCDAVVVNLECCVSDRGAPTTLIPDKPFFFRSPPEGVESLQAIGTTAASVANNHALDFGPDALADTITHLEAAGIAVAGGEPRGVLVDAGGFALGVLAMSDHPAEYAPAIAYADLRRGMPDWVGAELERLRAAADVVLAFPHWGPNMTPGPARWQRHRAAEMIDAGAHAVAGHSAHVFHGMEELPGGLVLYDLGDALDDYAVDAALRNDLGILALWRPDGSPRLELVGLRLDFCRTQLASGAEADWIASRLTQACAELGTTVERTDESRFVIGD